jgi:hypothetical protein
VAQLLIYTSAKKLLAAGRTGFGTVARSRNISPLVTGVIERLSQFDTQRGADRSRVIFAHRRINAGNESIHLLSSTRDAGSDYTGRTNHIAHHLLITIAEARSLALHGINPADVLQDYAWFESWDGAPQYFEDGEDVNLLTLPIQRVQASREQWQRCTGNGLHARVLASRDAPKSAILVCPDKATPLALMAEALSELKEGAWGVSFTTSLESTDNVGDFSWILTTASELESVQSRCASRSVLRADRADQLPLPEDIPSASLNTDIRQQARQTRSIPVSDATAENLSLPQMKQEIIYTGGQRPSHQRNNSVSFEQRPEKRNVSRIAIIASSVALVLAAVILFIVIEKRSGADIGGTEGVSVTGQVEADGVSAERKRFRSELTEEFGIDFEDAEKIAVCVNEIDFELLKNYFSELKAVCESELPWTELKNSQDLGEGFDAVVKSKPPKSAPQWLVNLLSSSGNKKVFNDLYHMASGDAEALTSKQWRDFDGMARSSAYATGFPFNKGGWGNPFPKMALELLTISIRSSIRLDRDEDWSSLAELLKLELWQDESYQNILQESLAKLQESGTKVPLVNIKQLIVECDSIPLIKKTLNKYAGEQSKGGDATRSVRGESTGDSSDPGVSKASFSEVVRRYIIKSSDLKHEGLKTGLLGNEGKLSKLIINIDSEVYIHDPVYGKLIPRSGEQTKLKIQIDGDNGKLKLDEYSELFSGMLIQHNNETEHICVIDKKFKGGEKPMWGAHDCQLKQKNDDLLLEGGLIDRLNELKNAENITFKGKNTYRFKRKGDKWKHLGFYTKRICKVLPLVGGDKGRSELQEAIEAFKKEHNKKLPRFESKATTTEKKEAERQTVEDMHQNNKYKARLVFYEKMKSLLKGQKKQMKLLDDYGASLEKHPIGDKLDYKKMMYFADEILQLSDSDRVRKQEKIDERIIEIVEQEQEIKVYADDSRLIFIGKIQ